VEVLVVDPLQFRADSMLGAPGLMLAARLGNVTIANAVGNGVADDKLLYTYVPDLIRYYLAEEPVLQNVDTWRLEDPGALEEVLDRLDELVVKPVDGSGGKGLLIGPDASPAELESMRRKLSADPRGWIAQPVVMLSTIPTLVDDGVRPRHADLRPFAVNDGERIWVLPGGLTRVALPEGRLVVNSSQGGGSKDTWVVGGDAPNARHAIAAGLPAEQVPDAPVPVAYDQQAEPAHSPSDHPASRGEQQAQQQQQQQQQGQDRDPASPGNGGAPC
ncbi:MAG: circularly permuted type 2 ATP-grasp protein, partial [Leucobacter sp.]